MFILLNILCVIIVFFIGADIFSLADEISYCASKEIDILKRKYSTCRECGHRLRVKDTFPVVSRIINKGKCRFCDAPFSKRGFCTEISGGIFALLVYIFFYYIIKLPIFVSAGLMIIISIVGMLVVAYIYAKPYLKNRKEKTENDIKKTKSEEKDKAEKIAKTKEKDITENKQKTKKKNKTDKKNTHKDEIDREENDVDEIPKIDLF